MMVVWTARVVSEQEGSGWIADILKAEPTGFADGLDICIGSLGQRPSAFKCHCKWGAWVAQLVKCPTLGSAQVLMPGS